MLRRTAEIYWYHKPNTRESSDQINGEATEFSESLAEKGQMSYREASQFPSVVNV